MVTIEAFEEPKTSPDMGFRSWEKHITGRDIFVHYLEEQHKKFVKDVVEKTLAVITVYESSDRDTTLILCK